MRYRGCLKTIELVARWNVNRLRTHRRDAVQLLPIALNVGEWLRSNEYIGMDVRVGSPPAEFSTTLASSIGGWLNLSRYTGDPGYHAEAESCLERLTSTQTAEGGWAFPLPFRSNLAGISYSCETFMTLEPLLYHYGMLNSRVVSACVEKGLDFLLGKVGHVNGAFWYSEADRIRIPNVSAMAANVLARASAFLDRPELLDVARASVDFCLSEQTSKGAFPYEAGQNRVYVPYHALEIWELARANEILNDARIDCSIERATEYLRGLFSKGYDSFSSGISRRRNCLLKTPLWGARAFLYTGNRDEALCHFSSAIRTFQIPQSGAYFYSLLTFGDGVFRLRWPRFAAVFIRYNASLFEIATELLLATQISP